MLISISLPILAGLKSRILIIWGLLSILIFFERMGYLYLPPSSDSIFGLLLSLYFNSSLLLPVFPLLPSISFRLAPAILFNLETIPHQFLKMKYQVPYGLIFSFCCYLDPYLYVCYLILVIFLS